MKEILEAKELEEGEYYYLTHEKVGTFIYRHWKDREIPISEDHRVFGPIGLPTLEEIIEQCGVK